jgi:hypothetical protein
MRTEAQQFFARGVGMLCVFSGGVTDYYNHGDQILSNLSGISRKPGQLEHHYMPRADHTYSLKCDRDELIERVSGWMLRLP